MNPVSRRTFLAAAGTAAAASVLAACTSTSAHDNTPASGGTLRVGALGHANKSERDPHQTLSNDSDFLISSLVFDALTVPGTDPTVEPRLASKWEQQSDPRIWHFTLAEGAAFHDGTKVTADDVVWSLRRLRDIAGETKVPVATADDITAASPGVVQIVTASPNRDLPLLLRLMTFTLKKGTTDFAAAVGTGPFKLESYRDGNATLVRNDAWYRGEPLLERIEVTLFETPDAMNRAVMAGQIDLASNVGAVAGRTAESNASLQVVRRPNDVVVPIIMRTSDGPFRDPRVREALRLTADREALVTQIFSDYGSVANDVLGTGDPTYDTSLPQRTPDLDKARKLLAEAAFDTNRAYQLFTKDEAVGEVDSAKLFAEQVAEIGVKVDVVVQDSTVFYDDTWLKADFYTGSWGTNDSVIFFASKTMYSGTKWNETDFHDADFDNAYKQALGATDDAAYGNASRKLQQIQYDRGGYLVWGLADGIDVAAAKVQDLPTIAGYGRVQLERVWLKN